MKTINTLLILLFLTQISLGQEIRKVKQEEQLNIEVKDDAHPDIYIDGTKYDRKILSLLDKTKINAIEVIKGQKAIDEYNAPYGVVFITTKTDNMDQIHLRSSEKVEIISESDKDESSSLPVIIINGKKSARHDLKEIDPNTIEFISVLGGEKAKKEYGTDGKVIIITTKE